MGEGMEKGIIISVQTYTKSTTQELAIQAVNAGAVGIRTDLPIKIDVPIIGLNKKDVQYREKEAYITDTVEQVERVSKWAQYIAIDFRRINKNLDKINDYCVKRGLKVIADIGHIDDFLNIKAKGYSYEYVATTMTVYKKRHYPDKFLIKKLKIEGCKKVIAEGNYRNRGDVKEAFNTGAHNVCIGGAVSDVYKLTRKYVTVII